MQDSDPGGVALEVMFPSWKTRAGMKHSLINALRLRLGGCTTPLTDPINLRRPRHVVYAVRQPHTSNTSLSS